MPRKGVKDWGRQPYPQTLNVAIDDLDTVEMEDIYGLFHSSHEGDSPSGSDIRKLFGEYQTGTLEFRAGVDAACIWAIGYRFDSLIASWYVRRETDRAWEEEGVELEDDWVPLVERWRNA